LRDIKELLEGSEKLHNAETAAKKQKLEEEASLAEELRQNSLETYGQTKARKGDSDCNEEPVKKRRSSNDMIGFLREKSKYESKKLK